MDKISGLLAEAKPLYKQRKRERQILTGTLGSLVIGVWVGLQAMLPAPTLSEGQFNDYMAMLYDGDSYFAYEVESDDMLPLDGYGFYEVS